MLPLWVADMDFPTAPGIQKAKVTQSHTESTDTAKEKMITSRQQPDGMRSISDGK